MLQQRAAGLGRHHALAPAHQQFGAETLLHFADASGGGGKRQVRARRAMRNAAGLDDMPEQAEIGEIEPHEYQTLLILRRQAIQNAYCIATLHGLVSLLKKFELV